MVGKQSLQLPTSHGQFEDPCDMLASSDIEKKWGQHNLFRAISFRIKTGAKKTHSSAF